jgi:Ca2+-transporting ATPase
MAHTPRPLKQPVLSSSQWVRIAFIGILTAIVTVSLEQTYEATGAALAATMGFVVFSLMSVAMGLSARSETATALNRDIFSDRTQLLLYGLALGMAFLSTELGFLQRLLGTVSLNRDQWLTCIGFAVALLLVDEVIKFFMRRRRRTAAPSVAAATAQA